MPRLLYGFLGLLLVHDALRRFGRRRRRRGHLGPWRAVARRRRSLYYMTIAPGFSHAASLFAVSLLLWLWLRARATAARGPARLGARSGWPAAWPAWCASRTRCSWRRPASTCWRGRSAGAPGWRACVARSALAAGRRWSPSFPSSLAYRALNGRFGPSRPRDAQDELLEPALPSRCSSTPATASSSGARCCCGRVRAGGSRSGSAAMPAACCSAGRLLFQVWINGSVESWTQAGAFGSRRFVAATLVFAWGLAALAGRDPDRARARRRRGPARALRLVERARSWCSSA